MTTQKKRRPHDLKDAANVETRWIEKIKTVEATPPKTKKEVKKTPKTKYRSPAHEYELSPTLEKLKGVGARLQGAIKQKIDRHFNKGVR